MCIRNAILILTKIAKYFPANQKEGGALEGTISELIDTEKREDLKVLAMG
jgi:THO complex subunit 2